MTNFLLPTLRHFKRAAELNPTRLIHRIEIAKTHYALGEHELALKEVTAGLALPIEDLNSYIIKADGEELLRALNEKRKPRYGGTTAPEKLRPAGGANKADVALAIALPAPGCGDQGAVTAE